MSRETEKEEEWPNEVKRGERTPANVSETVTNDFVLWAAKVICSLDMQSQWFSNRTVSRREIPGRASSIVSHLVISKFRLPQLQGEFHGLETLFADRPAFHRDAARPWGSLAFTSRYYERK